MPHDGTLINFPGQEANEHIFIFTRRHPVAFLPMLGLVTLMTGLGLFLIFLLRLGEIVSYNQQILIGSVFLLFMLLFALIEFFDFYFDLHIVTDRRLVDIDQHKLFNRSVAELLLEDIQDSDAITKGILGTFFNFGTVFIQTAGARANFELDQIPFPNEIAAMILDLSDQTQRGISIADRHPEGSVAAIVNGRLLPHTPDHQNEITL